MPDPKEQTENPCEPVNPSGGLFCPADIGRYSHEQNLERA
jgi:hypothetical protein